MPPTDVRDSADRIRVLRIFSRLNVGGPSIHVVLLTAELDPTRYESTLVVGKEGEREGNLHELARSKSVQPITIETLGRSIRPLDDLRSFVELWRRMRRERPHVVHTHTAKAGALGRIAALAAGVPVVVHTFHGSVFSGYFGRAGSAMYRLVEKALALVTDAIIGVSPEVSRELATHGLKPRHGIHTVSLGLELERFIAPGRSPGLRTELGLDADANVIGSVGRLAPIKDLPTLLSAVVRVEDAHLVLVGDGPERARLESLASELGISPRVHFTGFRSGLEDVYPDFDVVVNSSRNEGTPVALIEAMAAGVPVVATRVGGSVDLLKGGALGALVPPAEPEALADAIGAVLSEPGASRERSRAARAHVLAMYTSSRLLVDIDALYRDLFRTKGISFGEPAIGAAQA